MSIMILGPSCCEWESCRDNFQNKQVVDDFKMKAQAGMGPSSLC